MRFAEHTKRRRLHWSTKPERRLGPWIIIILIVTVLAGVVSVPPDVAQAQSDSQCFSGLRIDAVTVSPHKTRAGVGQVVVEFVIKNDDRSDRSISLRANITDSNDQVVKQWEESSSLIPRKTGIFRFGIPGEYSSSVTWAAPSGAAAGRYSVNVYILSEDKTQECRRYVYRGAFDVISRDYPWAVAESPAYRVFVKKGYQRTFTASATDGNNDLSGYQWHVDGVQQVNQPIVAAGFFSSDFEHVFDVVGKSYVRATFVDGGGRNDSVSWEVEVSDLADFCDEESSQVICGYASDWAHDGYEPLDSTISVQLHEPLASGELNRLEITIQDPYELEAAGYFAVAVPQKAWVEYRGIQKWIQVRANPGVWSPLSPQQERDAGILDAAGDFILGILLGFVPHGVVTVLSTADFVSSLGEGPRPENAVFRGTYLNCFRQVEMPWIAPEAITGIRISIPVDLVEGDYTALVSRFRAYSLLREGATELGPVEDAFIEIHDPLRSGDREEPPSCERFERTAAETALPATNLGDPTGLTATPGSQGGAVSLSWTPGANATVHRVYLQKEDGTGGRYWSQALAGDAGAATIAGLEAGQIHQFWVRAGQLLSDGNTHWSAWSNWARGTPTSGTVLTEAQLSISSGGDHTCGLRADGAAVCWGYNRFGQATPPAGEESFAAISSGELHTCGLRADGAAVCWGWNVSGQATPPAGENFTAISSGSAHTCGLRADESALCWGRNYSGQATPPAGENFTAISSGGGHTCGLRADGAAVCWGDNRHGQATPPPGENFRRHQQRPRRAHVRAARRRGGGLLGPELLWTGDAAGGGNLRRHQQRRMAHVRAARRRVGGLLGQ